MDRLFFGVGCLSALVAVALGAFGAHGLRGRLVPDMLMSFEIGVRYQMYHAFGLFVVAWASSRWPDSNFNPAGWSFIVGIIIFSGSLYLLSLTGIRWLGAITPAGGIAFLIGWAILIWTAGR